MRKPLAGVAMAALAAVSMCCARKKLPGRERHY
jgi:hypothetical protein